MSIYPEKTIRAVLDKLEAGPLLKLINYRTDTIQITGGTVKCFCPVHKEQVFHTLIITTKDKSYRCSYSLCPGNKGGDLISLFALSRGLEYDEGLVTLVKELNIDIELPTTQEFIDKTVEVAENYLELAALDEAESGFSKVAEIQPGNIAAHKGLLEIHTARKNEEKIIQELKKLISLLTAARKYDDALVFATMLVEKTPESKEAHYLMVECHEGLEDFSSALGEYMNLADLHEMDGEFDKALEVYHKIESLGLDLIDVYPHIINVLVASNRTEDAIAETIKRATAFHQTREYEKTLECYRYILELDTSRHDIRKQYIQLALEVGMTPDRVDECLRIVDEMLEQHAVGDAIEALHALSAALPADVGILGKLIAVYLEQGRDGEAETLELRLSDILESEGNLEGALEPLHSIISRNPASTEALFRTAGINTARGEPGLAVEAFLSIIKIHKDKGEYLNAIGAYDHLMQVAPDEVPFREQQIDLYIEAGLKEDAFNRCLQLLEYLESKKQNEQLITKFRFALKLKPQEVSLIIRLADHLLRMKYINEARDEYFHAYEVLRKGGKPDLAAKQLLRCLDINPDDRKALQALGETLVEAGDPKRAFQYLRKLADSYLQEENYEEAQKVLRQLLAIQPDDINILTLLVNAYSKLGYENEVVETYETMNSLYLQKEAFNKVIEICREILTLRPDNVSAHQQLISVYERTNRQADAIQLLLGLADIHSRSGNLAQEEECYDTILRKDNANVEARKRHVFLLLKLSRKQAAYKEARILSDQYTARNQTPLAVALYSSLLESDPDELPLNLHLLELQKKTGNNDDITKQIQRIIQIYLQRDQKPIAAEYYGELIRYAPDNTGFRKALVDLLIDLDHIDEALVQTIQLADCHVLREEFQN
ncbi:MAG TPA: tetratricopeptide repeat protein, partial [Candidatus Sumerlaeota bacterium]|nr:tetratricopeptide repeat protein [Candidatus Sumerlaeota bacterium]